MVGVFVIVALIATTGTYAADYRFTENVFQEAYPIQGGAIPAAFIKGNHYRKLKKPTYDGRNGIIFYSDPSPPPEPISLPPKMKDVYCVNNDGISLSFQNQIPDQLVACKIVSFRWGIKLIRRGLAVTYFTLYFQYGFQGPIVLIIPVFEKPSQVPDERWAEENKVAFLHPAVENLFGAALKGKQIPLNLIWFKNVLSYGVFKNKKRLTFNGEKLKSFVTRPVLLPRETIFTLLFKIDANKAVNNDWNGYRTRVPPFPTSPKTDDIKLEDTKLDDTMLYDYGLGNFKSDVFMEGPSVYDGANAVDAFLREEIPKEIELSRDELLPNNINHLHAIQEILKSE